MKAAVAGEPSTVRIRFFDTFGNLAKATESFRVSLAVVHEARKKLQDVNEHGGGWWMEPGLPEH